MTEYTRPATWDDVKQLARLLREAQVAYALIGGYAIAAHGYNRFSEDVDILVDPAPENTRRWVQALSHLPDGASGELLGQDDIFQRDGPYAIRVNDEFTVDVMPAACGHAWDELKGHIETRQVDGEELQLLSLTGLLLTKQGARPKDQADAQVLRAAIAALSKA
jgi:hypothetical protein